MKQKSVVKQLNDAQLEDFDWEFVGDDKKATIKRLIDEEFSSGKFCFLDVGGGNGAFTDWLLEEYRNANGVVLDNSDSLLSRNSDNPRKMTVLGSATELDRYVSGKFDIIFFNYVLHHLITRGYSNTRRMQCEVLLLARKALRTNGRISVIENLYDGMYFDGLPSHLIFWLTSARTIAPLVRRMGANTAGVGVCFLAGRQWTESFSKCGLTPIYQEDYRRFEFRAARRAILHLGDVRGGLFWCRSEY